jgi:hypothetical protein
MKKSKFITLNFSLDRSSSHRAWSITDIAVLVGNFTDTSIRRVVEGLKSSGLAACVVRSILSFKVLGDYRLVKQSRKSPGDFKVTATIQ